MYVIVEFRPRFHGAEMGSNIFHHFQAGSSKVLELHGTNSLVGCLSCTYKIPRHSFQTVLAELNPHLSQRPEQDAQQVRPDGDVELSAEEVEHFCVPGCPKCSAGILKPVVVFFGDNVPKQKVAQTRQLVIFHFSFALQTKSPKSAQNA